MKWIKYQIEQSVINEQPILIDKKIGYSEANLAIAQEEAYNGKYTIEEDDVVYKKEPLAIELGGTGGATPIEARKKLGAAPSIVWGNGADVSDGAKSNYPDGTLYVVIE